MARPRRTRQASATTTPATGTKTASQSAGEFTCPECGKTFGRAASLGAHRNRAHGVAGANAAKRSTPRRRRAGTRATAAPTTGRRRSRSNDGTTTTVDRDALLQALFPKGVPAREAVIHAANDWLDQAERLAKLS
jgi:uncharacterized C2H2 Zn-finger protein